MAGQCIRTRSTSTFYFREDRTDRACRLSTRQPAKPRTQSLFMAKRVVASYCSSFLKPEMLHIYRQVKALRGVETFVVTKAVQNAELFPFRDIEVIPRRSTNLLRH